MENDKDMDVMSGMSVIKTEGGMWRNKSDIWNQKDVGNKDLLNHQCYNPTASPTRPVVLAGAKNDDPLPAPQPYD